MAIKQNYYDYLSGDKWKAKREKVLKRDNHLCQECKKEKACQVHHLTYKNVFDEPLTDLQSVCAKCHEEIHYYWLSVTEEDWMLASFLKFPKLLDKITGCKTSDFSNSNSQRLFECIKCFDTIWLSGFFVFFSNKYSDLDEYIFNINEIIHSFPSKVRKYDGWIKHIESIILYRMRRKDYRKIRVKVKREKWR